MRELWHWFRFVPVIALLGVAAALLRRRGEWPLALRGLRKILGRAPADAPDVPVWKKLLAFGCVLAALVLAVL